MQVFMVLSREWQDHGHTQFLDVGQVYDVPDVVGAALLAGGAAVPPPDRATDQHDQGRPPETKPMTPPETKAPRKP